MNGAGGNTRYRTIEKICLVFGLSIGTFWNGYQEHSYEKKPGNITPIATHPAANIE